MMVAARLGLAVLCSLLLASGALVQTASGGSQTAPAPKPAAPAKPRAAAKRTPPASAAFLAAQKAAEKARDEKRLDDAIAEYFKAVKLQPNWTEGWWYLGTISYDQDRYQPARDAFKRVVMLDQKNAAAHAFLGLSQFQLKEYDQALTQLLAARLLGLPPTTDLASVVRYHAAIIFIRMSEFEQAGQLLNEFAVEGNDSPRVIEVFGISTLRLPLLPSELPPEKRDAAMMVGRAEYLTAARMIPAAKQAFERVIARYPETSGVHYAYGVFLLNEEPDKGLDELQKELKLTPGDARTMLAMTFEYIKRSDMPTALSWAQKAVASDPQNFAARKALGQVLLESGDTDGAIRELETGVKIAPDSPALHFQLAKAYQKAGRSEEAQRERAEFTRLDRQIRAARAGAQSVGGSESPAPESAPNQQD